METEQDPDKMRGCEGVVRCRQHLGAGGRWTFDVARRPGEVPGVLGRLAGWQATRCGRVTRPQIVSGLHIFLGAGGVRGVLPSPRYMELRAASYAR